MFDKDLLLWIEEPGNKHYARFILLIMVLFLLVSCSQTKLETPKPTVTTESTPTQMAEEPAPTITSTPTQTPVPTETPTPTPIPLTEISYLGFIKIINVVGEKLLLTGWHYFDDYDLFSEFPYYPIGNVTWYTNDYEFVYEEAYEKNSTMEFWCSWSYDGFVEGFGWWPSSHFAREDWWEDIRESIGNSEKVVYCKEFDVDYWDFVENEWDSKSYYSEEKFDEFPTWTEEERLFVLNNYFISMSEAIGWVPIDTAYEYEIEGHYNWVIYPWVDVDWTIMSWEQAELDKLSNQQLCWLMANHIAFGLDAFAPFSGYEPPNVGWWLEWHGTKTWYNSLIRVREQMDRDLASLCPNFLSMVEGPYFPHPDYLPEP